MNPKIVKQVITTILLLAVAAGAGIALRRSSSWLPSDAPGAIPEPVSTPESRDRARYSHVNEIRIALATHESTLRSYPENLSGLVPKYLAAEPLDPSSKTPYQYKKDTGGYVLSFTLENGVFALSAGDHVMTSRGFDMYSPEPEKPAIEVPAAVTVIPASEEEIPVTPRQPENPLPPVEPSDEEQLPTVETTPEPSAP